MDKNWNIKFVTSYDVDELSKKVLDLSEDYWKVVIDRGDHGVHSKVEPILLIDFPLSWTGEGYPSIDNLNNFSFGNEVRKIIEDLENRYSGKVGRVLLLKLQPQSSIPKHVDHGYYLTVNHRCHVPLYTRPGVDFTVDTDTVYMDVGTCYEINNSRLHHVENNTDLPRIHLLVDIIPKDLIKTT